MLDEKTKQSLILSLLGLDKKEETAISENGEWKIVVLQRGWVVVGKYFRSGTECRLEDSSKGLGELDLEGCHSMVNAYSGHGLNE